MTARFRAPSFAALPVFDRLRTQRLSTRSRVYLGASAHPTGTLEDKCDRSRIDGDVRKHFSTGSEHRPTFDAGAFGT